MQYGYNHLAFKGGIAAIGAITYTGYDHVAASPHLPTGGIATGVLTASGGLSVMSALWLSVLAMMLITLGFAITRFIPKRER